VKYFLIALILLIIPISAYATHQSTNCSITINGEILPVIYINEQRGNPDGSFYAGDSFHYLFTFTGIEECTSFTVLPIESEGIFNVIYHNSIMWDSPAEKIHSHNDYTMKPKYLTTTHYYVDKIHHCRNNPDCQSLVLAENPSYSVQEGQTMPSGLQKLFDGLRTASTYDIRTETTQDWGFANMDGAHEHVGYSHINESDESIISFEDYVLSRCDNLKKYSGCVFGHVELEPELRYEKCMWEELEKINISHDIINDWCVNVNHNLSLTIQGTKLSCNNNECKTLKVTKTKNITPNIIPSEFEIILTDPPVKDRDNYDGKNKDDTYYPHDPIGIIHNPGVLWKDYRAETIQFVTTKEYLLTKEYEYDCFENQCDYTIELNSVYPVSYDFGNGQGITIYNGTVNDFGTHDFDYYTTMTNLDHDMYTAHNTINREIVDYFPQYISYPYPLLSDNQELAFDDRQAVALYYVGSVEDGKTYENRRSKINYVHNIDVGYDPWTPHTIIQNFTLHEGITVTDGTVLSHNETAVFSQSGYGKLYFEHPLTDKIMPDGVPKFENVTSYTTLISNDFAGTDTIAEFYTMRYTEASFTKNLIIQSVNQNGTIMYDDMIQLEVTPYDKINTEYIIQYIYDKILFDTNDEIFADIISGDVYSMEQKHSGNGIINTTISKTSVFFDEYVEQTSNVNATFTENIINELEKLLDSPETIRLMAPYDLGLSTLSPTTLSISVNDITNTIDERYYTFGGEEIILVNTQTDNILHAERDRNKIVIYQSDNFGTIDTVYIDDILVEQKCIGKCVILYPPEDEISISAHNKWGGISYVTLPKVIIPEIPIPDEPNYMAVLAIVILLIIIYVIYKKVKSN